jgi:hypothetical protein
LGNALRDGIRSKDITVRDEAGAKALEDTFKRFLAAGHVDDDLAGLVPGVDAWIAEQRKVPGAVLREMPVLLLQAVLWEALQESPFVNLSFRFDDPASSIIRPILRTQPPLFATVAAGNESAVMPVTWAPQDAASSMRSFVNVTYGSATGEIQGNVTNGGAARRVVSLVAPGCGFVHDAVKADDQGSSLAAPFVSVVSWIRHLLDDVAPGDMRRELVANARLLPASVPDALEAGAFDMWRFLAASAPHAVTTAGGVLPLTNARFEFTGPCEDSGGGTHVLTPEAGKRRDVLVFAKDGGFTLLVRTVPGRTDLAHVDVCRVSSLKLEADGLGVAAATLDQFAANVRYLSL